VQDYGESHYLAPVRGAQPNSQAWVDGFPHAPWLALNAYFARAFKVGYMPPVERDKIFLWARPHPKGVTAPDPVPRPRDWELVRIAIFFHTKQFQMAQAQRFL
jgi:glucan endo-1,3-alpha-glucosidase